MHYELLWWIRCGRKLCTVDGSDFTCGSLALWIKKLKCSHLGGPPEFFWDALSHNANHWSRRGHWGLLETAKPWEKIIPTEKPKQIDQNRKQHAKLSKPIPFQTPVFKPDTMVTSGAHRVNYTNFITIFVNAMDWALLSSSICLSYMLYFSCSLEDLERGLCGLNS